jgi:hypothetical protein
MNRSKRIINVNHLRLLRDDPELSMDKKVCEIFPTYVC